MRKKNKIRWVSADQEAPYGSVCQQPDGTLLTIEQQNRLDEQVARLSWWIRITALLAIAVIAGCGLTIAFAYRSLSAAVIGGLAGAIAAVLAAAVCVAVIITRKARAVSEKIRFEAADMQDELRAKMQRELSERKRCAVQINGEDQERAYREAMESLRIKRDKKSD